ncbi:MAG: DUF89 family protein [Dehalococcoidia bacterium]|nr:MAG: DUF89 family protein [Dehalococcoidia bacterium]
MKTSQECYPCLQRLIHQAAQLATADEGLKAKAVQEGLRTLEQNFSCDEISLVIATELHRVIREVTQNDDPYREMKEKETMVAKELFGEIDAEHCTDFRNCLKLATKANAIDFFRPLDAVIKDLKQPLQFAIDDSEQFRAKLREANKVLYLADNTGEALLDLPLIRLMEQSAEVTYVVKASPVQDDVTLEDLRRAGIEDQFGRVITTGTATPGIVFSQASNEFKHEFQDADLVFAKGMGYYESLSELPPQGRVFYCLMAKCKPVADSLKVSLNSYVALLR